MPITYVRVESDVLPIKLEQNLTPACFRQNLAFKSVKFDGNFRYKRTFSDIVLELSLHVF